MSYGERVVTESEPPPVGEAARCPGRDGHVAVGEEHCVVRVLVLLHREKHGDVDDRDGHVVPGRSKPKSKRPGLGATRSPMI